MNIHSYRITCRIIVELLEFVRLRQEVIQVGFQGIYDFQDPYCAYEHATTVREAKAFDWYICSRGTQYYQLMAHFLQKNQVSPPLRLVFHRHYNCSLFPFYVPDWYILNYNPIREHWNSKTSEVKLYQSINFIGQLTQKLSIGTF